MFGSSHGQVDDSCHEQVEKKTNHATDWTDVFRNRPNDHLNPEHRFMVRTHGQVQVSSHGQVYDPSPGQVPSSQITILEAIELGEKLSTLAVEKRTANKTIKARTE